MTQPVDDARAGSLNTPNPQPRTARLIALYLPQFHPIPENDAWWGLGYTDWIAVAGARPLFRGHLQPNLPGELGFYDLRLPETRHAQAELARDHGVEAFCYWHYWFGGKQLLEQPFNAVLRSREPNFPFCLAWANHTWNSVWWFGVPGKQLIEQTYPGPDDHRAHFEYLLPALADERYLTVDGKPLFYIYDPFRLPDIKCVTDQWRELALAAGLKGLHLVGLGLDPAQVAAYGCDAATYDFSHRIQELKAHLPLLGKWAYRYPVRRLLHRPVIYSYADVVPTLLRPGPAPDNEYAYIVPRWDNTPRSRYSGMVYHQATPELYRLHLRQAIQSVAHRPLEHRLLFVKSWNEWGEGNYLEPDRLFGRAYLHVTRQEIYGEAPPG